MEFPFEAAASEVDLVDGSGRPGDGQEPGALGDADPKNEAGVEPSLYGAKSHTKAVAPTAHFSEASYHSGSLGSEGHKQVFKPPLAPEKIRTIADVECNVADAKRGLARAPSQTATLDDMGAANPKGQLTTFSGQCEAMHTWFNQKQSQGGGLAVKAGSTGLEKRHVVLQANNKLVLFSRTKESPLSRNAALFDEQDLTKRHKTKFLRNQLNYGNIEQHNVDKACQVESVIDLALLGSARINKNVMDLHLSVLKGKD